MSRIGRLAGLVFTVGPALYLIAEAVTAHAWSNPTYSYTRDWISDLGVPDCGMFHGRFICSPRHAVMNAGFALQGVALGIGSVALAHRMPPLARWATRVTAVAVTIGNVLVGAFHTSNAAAANGTIAWHSGGATVAIVGGNLLFVLVGLDVRRRHRRLAWLLFSLSSVGLISTVVLGATGQSSHVGAVERLAVYPILASQLVCAGHLWAAQYPIGRRAHSTTSSPDGSPA